MAGQQSRALQSGSADTANAGITTGITALTLTHPCYEIRIVNNSNRLVHVRYGYQKEVGTVNNDHVRAGADMEVITQTNSLPPNLINLWPVGTTVTIVADSTGSGLVYVTGYYQEN